MAQTSLRHPLTRAAVAGFSMFLAGNALCAPSPDQDRRTSVTSLRQLGAKCDGSSDDSAALRKALSGAYSDVSGERRWCSVRGNFVLLSHAQLHHVWLKQMDSAGPNRRTLTTPGGSTVSDILLDDVKVDRKGRAEEGDVHNDGGLWLVNIRDSELRDVEVSGDGKGIGIFIAAGTGVAAHIKVIRPDIHDMHWSAQSDPCTEQILGLWFDGATDVEVDSPHIAHLLGKITSGKYCQLPNPQIPLGIYLPYQTDGLDFSNTHGARISGGLIVDVGEGSDSTGSGTNRRIWFYGTHFRNCGSFCLKMVHDIADSGSINVVAERPGLAGLVHGDGSPHDAAGATDIVHKNFTVIDAGAPYDYGGGNIRLWQDGVAGIKIEHSSKGGPPVHDIRLRAPVIVDKQANHTMAYGISRELPTQDVQISSPKIEGALVSRLHNFSDKDIVSEPRRSP